MSFPTSLSEFQRSTSTELEKEKGVVLEEIAMVNDNVEELGARKDIGAVLYGKHPFKADTRALQTTYRKFTRSDLLGLYTKALLPREHRDIRCRGAYDEAAAYGHTAKVYGRSTAAA